MDPRVTEFQCIMPMENIRSVMIHGILSHERASRLTHASVAMEAIQEKRDVKFVPGGLRLHQYANLYFHARNPMLFKRKDKAKEICVLRVSVKAGNLKGVVLSDSNASSAYARFLAPSQWQLLDYDDIYAMDWRHPGNQIAYFRHRSHKCAEILLPHEVPARFITGAYVVNEDAKKKLESEGFDLPVTIDPVMFFQ